MERTQPQAAGADARQVARTDGYERCSTPWALTLSSGGEHSARLWAILDEAVLRRTVGPAEVMHDRPRAPASSCTSLCSSCRCRPAHTPDARGR
ncbi:Scr1 family TA system antitoxin-like transcriptional regulator [Streptomyces sp. NPDC006208]|uniref:Scr1 family TA system antitoxin-like transcriptional regulator n=1 Tax=Streptomyces sp. NPDC006208 TaxID=3156734 RepID=UPI0033BA5725